MLTSIFPNSYLENGILFAVTELPSCIGANFALWYEDSGDILIQISRVIK